MRTYAVVLTLLVMACASGNALREEGFNATPAGSGAWWVSYEGNAASAELARDNLLYHSARLVLDRGGKYFTLEQAQSDRQLEQERARPVDEELDPRDPRRERSRSRVPFQRGIPVTAMVEMVEGPGEGVLNASNVIDELTSKYAR